MAGSACRTIIVALLVVDEKVGRGLVARPGTKALASRAKPNTSRAAASIDCLLWLIVIIGFTDSRRRGYERAASDLLSWFKCSPLLHLLPSSHRIGKEKIPLLVDFRNGRRSTHVTTHCAPHRSVFNIVLSSLPIAGLQRRSAAAHHRTIQRIEGTTKGITMASPALRMAAQRAGPRTMAM